MLAPPAAPNPPAPPAEPHGARANARALDRPPGVGAGVDVGCLDVDDFHGCRMVAAHQDCLRALTLRTIVLPGSQRQRGSPLRCNYVAVTRCNDDYVRPSSAIAAAQNQKRWVRLALPDLAAVLGREWVAQLRLVRRFGRFAAKQ